MRTGLVNASTGATSTSPPGLKTSSQVTGTQRCFNARDFLLAQHAYRRLGGVASGDELAYVLREHVRQPLSLIARWIVEEQVVCYEWRSPIMLPLFQFELARASVRPCVASIIHELRGSYENWSLAMWFVKGNPWLGGETPLEAIDTRPHHVLMAARSDRSAPRS